MLKENSQYIHEKTGNTYTVLMLANQHSEDWPTEVIYQSKYGRVWARPLKEFLNRFKPLEQVKP